MGTARDDDHVAEAVVTVHHCDPERLRPERLRHCLRQPGPDVFDERERAGGVHVPELGEAPNLAFQIAARPQEWRQGRLVDIRFMDLDQGVDQVFGHTAPGQVILDEAGRQFVGDDGALDVVRDVKRHPEKAFVLANGANARHPDTQRRQRQLETRLANDVVRRRRQWWTGRPAQYVAFPVAFEQEREVRPSAVTDPGGGHRTGTELMVI